MVLFGQLQGNLNNGIRCGIYAYGKIEMECHCLRMVHLTMDNKLHHQANEFSAELNEFVATFAAFQLNSKKEFDLQYRAD